MNYCGAMEFEMGKALGRLWLEAGREAMAKCEWLLSKVAWLAL